jgi:Ser/Thr protein kinase RdoA (MazF antagonist)
MFRNSQLAQESRDARLTEQVAVHFDMPGAPVGMFPVGSGNINDTFLAIYRTSYSETRCIIQRINKRVFQKPEALLKNFKLVTEHVHRRLEKERSTADRIWQLPRLIPAKDGTGFHVDEAGDYWRAITLIDSAVAYDRAQGTDHAREAGSVLGQFHRLVMDLDPDSLDVTIPGFHHTPGYLATYDRTLATAAAQACVRDDRLTADLCRFVAARRDLCSILDTARAQGDIKVRIMHGDPKTSNILMDNITRRGTSIIDLDTVGSGLVQWDYGDAVRSLCNPAGEDAPELDAVEFSLDLCQAFTAGYIGQAADFLTPKDRAYLYDSIRLITFELGLRFLQDHLAGNVYFKTRHGRHNLDRAAVQFRLCERVEAHESKLRALIARCT